MMEKTTTKQVADVDKSASQLLQKPEAAATPSVYTPESSEKSKYIIDTKDHHIVEKNY